MTLSVQNLTVRLGGAAVVESATLDFAPGRVTAILGPNGAGKTSLIRAIAGLVAHEGAATINGAPISALSLNERARRIGYLPQNGTPAWNVTVRELVALGRLPHRSHFASPSFADEAAIDSALQATDTTYLAHRTVDALSGGERARVKMARVLAGSPDWILADEPLANLDPPHQRDMLNLFRASSMDGKGVIVVLHQLNAAMRVADDVVLMKAGRVIASGAKADVLTPELLAETFDMAFALVTAGNGQVIVPGS